MPFTTCSRTQRFGTIGLVIEGTVVWDGLRTDGYRLIVYKGAIRYPSRHMEFTYPIQTNYLFEKGLRTLTV